MILAAEAVNASYQRPLVIGASVLVCLVIVELVRRRRLMERYALIWLASGFVILLFALWQGLLTTLSSAVGIYYPPSLLFVMVGGFALALLMHFSMTVSRLSMENKLLAQRVALLQERLDEPTPAPAAAPEARDR